MFQRLRVTVLGATGTVGQKIVRLLSDHPWFEVTSVAASPRISVSREAWPRLSHITNTRLSRES